MYYSEKDKNCKWKTGSYAGIYLIRTVNKIKERWWKWNKRTMLVGNDLVKVDTQSLCQTKLYNYHEPVSFSDNKCVNVSDTLKDVYIIYL